MADLFGRAPYTQDTPITADDCQIILDGTQVAEATQVSISYNQSVTRRRSIGGKVAVIYGSQPVGQATIARMVISEGDAQFFSGASWNGCKGGTVTFIMAGCGGAQGGTFSATGCIVTSYQIQAQAEDLTVVDNITIDFLQLTHQ